MKRIEKEVDRFLARMDQLGLIEKSRAEKDRWRIVDSLHPTEKGNCEIIYRDEIKQIILAQADMPNSLMYVPNWRFTIYKYDSEKIKNRTRKPYHKWYLSITGLTSFEDHITEIVINKEELNDNGAIEYRRITIFETIDASKMRKSNIVNKKIFPNYRCWKCESVLLFRYRVCPFCGDTDDKMTVYDFKQRKQMIEEQ